jgi:hypothetical protein
MLDDLAPIEAWKDSVMRSTQQSVRDSFVRDIWAIEAEARADALAEVAAAVEGLTDPVDAERFRAAVLALLEKAS